jgi:hypothetical protein
MKNRAVFYDKIVKHTYAFNKTCNPWSDVTERLISFKRSILVQTITKLLSINEISPEQNMEITILIKLVGDHSNSKQISDM